MARAIVQVPARAKRGEIIEITRARRPRDGDRLSPHRVGRADPARHHPAASSAPTTASRCSAPTSIRRSPPTRSSASPPSPPRAARSNSAGPATTASPRPSRRRSPSSDSAPLSPAPAARVRPRRRRRRRSYPRTSAVPATTSWAARRAPCRTTTRPIPAMLWVLDGEALWNRKAGAAGQGLRRLPWRSRQEHERGGCALSGF